MKFIRVYLVWLKLHRWFYHIFIISRHTYMIDWIHINYIYNCFEWFMDFIFVWFIIKLRKLSCIAWGSFLCDSSSYVLYIGLSTWTYSWNNLEFTKRVSIVMTWWLKWKLTNAVLLANTRNLVVSPLRAFYFWDYLRRHSPEPEWIKKLIAKLFGIFVHVRRQIGLQTPDIYAGVTDDHTHVVVGISTHSNDCFLVYTHVILWKKVLWTNLCLVRR